MTTNLRKPTTVLTGLLCLLCGCGALAPPPLSDSPAQRGLGVTDAEIARNCNTSRPEFELGVISFIIQLDSGAATVASFLDNIRGSCETFPDPDPCQQCLAFLVVTAIANR